MKYFIGLAIFALVLSCTNQKTMPKKQIKVEGIKTDNSFIENFKCFAEMVS